MSSASFTPRAGSTSNCCNAAHRRRRFDRARLTCYDKVKSLRETFATEPRLRDECIRLVLAATHHLVHCALMDNADFSSTGQQISLCETLDRVLNKGVVVAGEVVISVADIDLIYLNLQLLLASFETAIALQESARPNHQFHRVEGP